MGFHWSLRDNKSLKVSRTRVWILDDLNIVVWMVSTCLLISKFSSPFTKSLGIIPNVPIIIGVTVTFYIF